MSRRQKARGWKALARRLVAEVVIVKRVSDPHLERYGVYLGDLFMWGSFSPLTARDRATQLREAIFDVIESVHVAIQREVIAVGATSPEDRELVFRFILGLEDGDPAAVDLLKTAARVGHL